MLTGRKTVDQEDIGNDLHHESHEKTNGTKFACIIRVIRPFVLFVIQKPGPQSMLIG